MRSNTHGGINERILVGQPHARLEIRRTIARADSHHPLDTRGARALDHQLPIFVELFAVEVAVRIDQPHFKRAPGGMSSWKPARTGLPSSTEAATIMPFDSMPFSLRG